MGRGSEQSYCFLFPTEDGVISRRLKALEEAKSGFELAEKDLEIRGPGDFLGTRQSGIPGALAVSEGCGLGVSFPWVGGRKKGGRCEWVYEGLFPRQVNVFQPNAAKLHLEVIFGMELEFDEEFLTRSPCRRSPEVQRRRCPTGACKVGGVSRDGHRTAIRVEDGNVHLVVGSAGRGGTEAHHNGSCAPPHKFR